MRIPNGIIDQYVYFKAVDSTDLVTPETGLTGFTVYWSKSGSASTQKTSPTVTEVSSANQPGIYALLVDFGTTLAAGAGSEELALTITKAGMAQVDRTVEIYRPNVTVGETLTVSGGLISSTTAIASVSGAVGSVSAIAANAVNAAALASDAVAEIQSGLATSAALSTVAGYIDTEISDIQSRLPAALVGGRMDASVGAMAANVVTASAIAADAIGASQLAASAVAEIQAGLSSLDAAGIRAALGLATANLDTQLSAIDDFLDTEVAAIKAKTDALPSDPADASDIAASFSTVNSTLAAISGYIDTEVAAIKADTTAILLDTNELQVDWADGGRLDTILDARASQASVDAVDGVVDAILVDTGTDIPTLLGTIDDYLDTEIAGIKAKTDLIPAAPAAVSDIPTAVQNADALLNRDMAAVSDTNSRTPLNALRALRNKVDAAGGTLTVTKENDSTTAWTAVLTSDNAADPIIGIDPA